MANALISWTLGAIQADAGELSFFNGTALARTYLPSGRLSEYIELIAITDRPSVASAISQAASH